MFALVNAKITRGLKMTDMSGDRVGVQSRSGVLQSQKDEVAAEGGVEGGIGLYVCLVVLEACTLFFSCFFSLLQCSCKSMRGSACPQRVHPSHASPLERVTQSNFPLSEFKIGSSM